MQLRYLDGQLRREIADRPDLAEPTRVVLKELLQGLREQGPDGYGPFIEDYFKRLTETKIP